MKHPGRELTTRRACWVQSNWGEGGHRKIEVQIGRSERSKKIGGLLEYRSYGGCDEETIHLPETLEGSTGSEKRVF